jgi:hypothetical protein
LAFFSEKLLLRKIENIVYPVSKLISGAFSLPASAL